MAENITIGNAGVVCFGEILLRLTAPAHGLLLQSGSFNVNVGGAEANVAVSLAQFGHHATVVTVLPDSPLGHAAAGELRRHGVRTDSIQFGPGRMGLYFLTTGAGHRPSEVLYDRADSAFALAPADLIDWAGALNEASWFHVSGITPAVGPLAAVSALRAVRAALKSLSSIKAMSRCSANSRSASATSSRSRSRAWPGRRSHSFAR